MYKFKSFGAQTNFLMDSFLAETTEKDKYFVIKTPKRPNYFWGNYILMKDPPHNGCFNDWVKIFEDEIGNKSSLGYCAITFDLGGDEIFDTSEFSDNGFKVGTDKILVADKIVEPKKLNSQFNVKEYDLSKNIDSFVEVHFDSDWAYGSEQAQTKFLKEQATEFQSLIERNIAKRFGAFLENKLVADLGIYWNNDFIRFNNISTHPAYRRKGVCSTLVYNVSKNLLDNDPDKKLVMQADEDYHAASIYESIGFSSKEKIILLEWKDYSKF